MKIRNASLMLLLLSSVVSQAIASETKDYNYKIKPSITGGYEWGKLQGYGKLKGGNLKFDMFPDKPVGLIFSTSFLQDKWDGKDKSTSGILDASGNRIKTRYFSTMLGPTIKINDMVSAYALVGGSWAKIKTADHVSGNDFNKPNLAYGYGLILNITDNLVLSAGYETSRVKLEEKKNNFSGYMANVGYRF